MYILYISKRLLKLNRAGIGPYSGRNGSLMGQYRAGGGRTLTATSRHRSGRMVMAT